MDYQAIVDSMPTAACIVRVEKKGSDDYGKICLMTGNRTYLDSIERPMDQVQMLTNKFVPGSEYTNYLTRDLNFEDSCFQAAVKNKLLHAYAHPARYDVWFNMSFIPLLSDDDRYGYCIYIMEINFKPDAKRLSTISADIATSVLETCIKLRSGEDFRVSVQTVCEDIRELCGSEHCCILLMDQAKRYCSVLCEAFSPDTNLLPMAHYVDEAFYDIADSWKDTISGSNCLIAKNKHDMDVVKERNPIWYESLTNAMVNNIVLFPLEFEHELMGYIWAINFDAEHADKIKETLELTTFILSSELYSFQMVERLHILSSVDMLTGVMNRNEMNNYVDRLSEHPSDKPVGVLFIDLNGLKVINDNEGHPAGDKLLQDAAKLLRKIYPMNSIFRAGGDEFVVILEDVTEEKFNQLADDLQKFADTKETLTFAMGRAYEQDSVQVRKALRNADVLMYENKNRYYKLHPEKKRNSTVIV